MVLRDKFKTLLILALLASVTGCSSTREIKLDNHFPSVLSSPKEIKATIVFDEEFTDYIANPNNRTTIEMGKAQVNLLSSAFQGLFNEPEFVPTREEADPNSQLVITPSVHEVQISTPSQTYLNVYEVWIKYNLKIEDVNGELIDNWFMPAYGKTPDSFLLSKTSAIKEASVVALRDAGAKLLLDFYRIPSVYGWLRQQEQKASP